MTTVNIYLTFNGTCDEAFNFYQSAFGGNLSDVNRYKDMPSTENGLSFSREEAEKIMHIALPISKETILMGCDTGGEWTSNYSQGNNFAITINTDTREEADRLFSELSKGGQVTMAMDTTFWGAYFGMFTDKFGINWMVSHTPKK